MGLREEQKIERTQRILDAAAELFGRDGFDHVKAEKIAEEARVSVGTLYNYFPGKTEILMTLIAAENERLEDIGRAYVLDVTKPVADILSEFVQQYFDLQNMMLNKGLWRKGFAISFADVTSKEARRLRVSDRALGEQVIDLANVLQSMGLLRQDVDCDVFGATLFNNANMLFLDFTRSENTSYQEVTHGIDTMTRALVCLAIPPKEANR